MKIIQFPIIPQVRKNKGEKITCRYCHQLVKVGQEYLVSSRDIVVDKRKSLFVHWSMDSEVCKK